MKDILISILGEYVPQSGEQFYVLTNTITSDEVTEVTSYLTSETVILSGVASWDISWIASCFILGLTLFCLFRLLGGILKW